MSSETPPPPAAPTKVRLEFVIALLGGFAAALMFYSLSSVRGQDERHLELLTHASEIQQRIVVAHLWMEQKAANKASARPDRETLANLDEAIKLATGLRDEPQMWGVPSFGWLAGGEDGPHGTGGIRGPDRGAAQACRAAAAATPGHRGER